MASSHGLSNVFQQCFEVFPSLFQFYDVMVSCSDTESLAITGGHRTKDQGTAGVQDITGGTDDQGTSWDWYYFFISGTNTTE